MFQNLPTLLVTGDGRLIVVGPVAEIYPGPLLPNLQVRTITEAGIQQLLALAAEHGLLTQREYDNPTEHRRCARHRRHRSRPTAPRTSTVAYALGDRRRDRRTALGLAEFVAEATGEWLYGDNPELGPEQAYVPESFLIRATPVTDLSAYEIEPTVVPWAEDVPPLTEAAECLAVPADVALQLFSEATQLTFFQEGDTVYQITAEAAAARGDGC